MIITEDEIFKFLCQKYIQRADKRQKSMGLQYTEAETHDLAHELSNFVTYKAYQEQSKEQSKEQRQL